MTVANNSFPVPKNLGDGLSEGNADILDRMVSIDLKISFGGNLHIDHPVTCNLVHHVIKKRYPGIE